MLHTRTASWALKLRKTVHYCTVDRDNSRDSTIHFHLSPDENIDTRIPVISFGRATLSFDLSWEYHLLSVDHMENLKRPQKIEAVVLPKRNTQHHGSRWADFLAYWNPKVEKMSSHVFGRHPSVERSETIGEILSDLLRRLPKDFNVSTNASYIERGSSIFLCLFLASLACRTIFKYMGKRVAMKTKTKASQVYLRYRAMIEKANKDRKRRPSNPAFAASPLVAICGVGEKKERKAQFCCDRSW